MKQRTWAFIFATVLLDVLALGVTIPVLPKLIEGFAGGGAEVGARAYGWSNTVWALMQLLFAPILGLLSDRFGRRPVILISCFGLGLDYLFLAVAPSLFWIFVGRIISGITAASFATAGAYIADVTPPEKRAGAFGMMGAAWGLGFVLGPAMGGLLGAYSPRLPFYVAGALSLLNALYGLFVLPESLPPERRAAFSWKRANPLGSLRLLRSHPQLLGLSAVGFLNQLAHQVYPSVYVLYVQHRFGWSERAVGLSLAAVGVLNILVQAGLVRPFVRRFGPWTSLFTGAAFGVAGYAIYGLTASASFFCVGFPVYAFMGLFAPSLAELQSRRVGPSEQGQLQGANGSLFGVSGILGPLIFTGLYASDIHSGAPFLLSAGCLAAAGLLAALVSRKGPAVS